MVLVSNGITFLRLFEDRGYSAKRLFIHLRETKKGREAIFGRDAILKWIVIFAYMITVFVNGIDVYYHLLVFTLYFAFFLQVVINIKNKELIIPQLSKGVLSAFGLALFVEGFLYSFAPLDQYLWILILDKMLLIIISLFLLAVSIAFDFRRDTVINSAIKKISNKQKLFSIAVVGSYNRGSTKEFISRILSLKYNVLATNESFNDMLGISKTINAELTDKSQIFVAEIDDYNAQDMREMCNLINPKIVVVSGINEQKLSVFGSIENILASKLEAVNSLARDGIALFNGNNNLSRKIYEMTKKKKFIYFAKDEKLPADIVATNIKENKFNISFDITFQGKKYSITNLRLLGRQNIENVLPAIFIGIYAGIDFSLIREGLSKIVPLPGTMLPSKIKSGAVLIDDTHNRNINSVIRSLSYMSLYRGSKILVLEPIVELGKKAAKLQHEIGEEIGRVCDVVFLTNDNHYPSISSGIKHSNPNCVVTVANPTKIAAFIKESSKREDVIVFEGNDAAGALSQIQSEKIY